MSRLLADVEAGKIDMILFTKLDRWFRNTQEYFKVQELLEKCGVEWKAIHEYYDTTTANGRMAITIFLAIAQNEREKGSERVKAVFDNKLKNREAFFLVPLGYKKELDKDGILRLVIDPETEAEVSEFWRMIREGSSVMSAGRTVNAKFGITRTYKVWLRLFNNELCRGQYAGIPNYCPAYIDPVEWQRIKDGRPIRQIQPRRIYLFTGLLRCQVCGTSLRSNYRTNSVREYYYYRCDRAQFDLCENKIQVSEIQVEAWLLNNVRVRLEEELRNAEIQETASKSKPKRNKEKINEKIRRLNVVYMGGGKTDDDYLSELADLKAQLVAAEREEEDTKPRDLAPLREFLASDFEEIYLSLEREEKRQLWRSIIDHLVVEGNHVVDVVFKT
jgi:DNA invertase Pin-like site-specific DNA recombinase